MLYQVLLKKIPDFKEVVPYASLKFKFKQHESIVFHTPLFSPTLFLGINKKAGYLNTAKYLEKKYGTPTTKIELVTRNIITKTINVFKFLLTRQREGDFPLNINDYERHICFFLSVNHQKGEAKLLGKAMYNPKEVFEQASSADLIKYLSHPKVKKRLRCPKILTEHSKLEL